jgi:hypothetical protein
VIETTAVKASAFYETNLDSIKFVKRLTGLQRVVKIDGLSFLCVPSCRAIAKQLKLEEDSVRREISHLIHLKWAREYRRGKKFLYAIGTPREAFLEKELERAFRKANRTVSGAYKQTEWRWIPLDHWTGTTLWSYILERFREKGIWAMYAKPTGRAQMQRLCGRVGVRVAKSVADYWIDNWDALKKFFKWYGNPHPALFEGFFWKLQDFQKTGIPTVVHDRKHEDSVSDDIEWKEFNG